MKQKFVIVCESAVVARDTNNLYLLGIYETIFAASVPVIQSKFAIATSFEDGVGEHEHKILIRHEDGSEIAHLKGKIVFGSTQKANYIGSFVGLPLPKFGKYMVEIYMDDILQPLINSFDVEQK